MELPNDPGFALRKLTGADNAAFVRLGTLFIQTSEEALENMRQSMESGDCEQSMKILHRLKPNVLMFGMKELHQAILELEELWKKQELSEHDFHRKCQGLSDGINRQLASFKEYMNRLSD